LIEEEEKEYNFYAENFEKDSDSSLHGVFDSIRPINYIIKEDKFYELKQIEERTSLLTG
jgi:hypothetical protein